jgi:adenine-specific DNA-methyltransferase
MTTINKQELANKIKAIDGLSSDEKSQLLELLHKQKKYGLVWEDKPEDIEEKLRNELPVLKEVKERAIISDDKDAPNHILIEGDNLEALTALSYTHKGKIDVIYIDPPYNTGNKDFVYNDNFVDKEDGYRHSKWLSFMKRRLDIAHGLLSDKGVIFISIDDNEQAQLKLLCDEVFLPENHIATLPTIMNLKGNQDQFGFAGTHEYTLVYSQDISKTTINCFNIEDEEISDWMVDEIGYYKKGANLKSTGVNAPNTKRPYLYYPIIVNNTGATDKPCGDCLGC